MTRRAPAAILGTGTVALVAFMLLGVQFGAAHVGVGKLAAVAEAAIGMSSHAAFRPWEATILLYVRLPRVVTGAFVGAGLAITGAALQALFRNPLADPGVLGVASGASLGAVTAMQLGLASATAWAIPGFAVAFAGGTAFAIYAIASRRGHLPVGTLLLAGVALGSLASALTTLLLSVSLEEYDRGREIFRWLMGGLEARTWSDVCLVAPATLVGSVVVLASSRELDALLLGETEAVALGVDVPRVRRRLIFATSLIVGAAVAVSGVIGFVGLVIPHLVRLFIGPSHSVLLPASAVFGAAFVVGADLLCRTVVAPEEIRLGVMTASLGAPFFLFLLLTRKREISIE